MTDITLSRAVDAIKALKTLIDILKNRMDRHEVQIDDLYARITKLESEAKR